MRYAELRCWGNAVEWKSPAHGVGCELPQPLDQCDWYQRHCLNHEDFEAPRNLSSRPPVDLLTLGLEVLHLHELTLVLDNSIRAGMLNLQAICASALS